MPSNPPITWPSEFGLDKLDPPRFFSSADEIDAETPQPHALRRAFEDLSVSGILCHERSPVIYFREVDRIEAGEVARIHRRFWNQGVAPILVLVSPDQVHVYSALAAPVEVRGDNADIPGLVESLNRVSDELRSFVISVESGEYFHAHRRSFDPKQRVDKALLSNLRVARQKLEQVQTARLDPRALDSLLCRLVFTCYLFDRKVIDQRYLSDLGIEGATHLREILARRPRSKAKADLYSLFEQLSQDFNGDLFSDDLEAEKRKIRTDHLNILDRFFHGTDVHSGQQAFWPYDFSIIPIETISAIYEHFLKAAGEEEKKEAGAFYTPRFLAELVLDVALEGTTSLLDKHFLDPACGSGIFLVGLFNRIAEEWKQKNPDASYEEQAGQLMQVLQESLRGVDSNPTACQITAFSLYLAFLDQLSPPDIRELQRKGRLLPHLVNDPRQRNPDLQGYTVWFADFFISFRSPFKADYVVGNPPWGSIKDRTAPVAQWCIEQERPFPDRQVATGFAWKAPTQLEEGGKVCFVLPHGILFNHSVSAVDFQRAFFEQHAVERVLNLVDYQRFLFEESEAPALVVRYQKEKPPNSAHAIDYWAPKSDWTVTQAELISVLPQDRTRLTIREVLADLVGDDAPLIWKERFWATPRDSRLLDRMKLYSRLRDIAGKRGDKHAKRWIVAEGFEPFGENDSPETLKTLRLTEAARVEAGTHALEMFLLPHECDIQSDLRIETRRGISDTTIFQAPLVLVKQGFAKVRVAFADFDVAYRHGIRGIHGPRNDVQLLAFLAVYLRSRIARYFLFHTSTSWGVSRARVDVDDLMRLPFPFPDQLNDPKRANAIVTEVHGILQNAMQRAAENLSAREAIVNSVQEQSEPLVEEYFDIDEIEKLLILDTSDIVIPSVRPTRARPDVPSVKYSSREQRDAYVELLCDMLNSWARNDYQVHGWAVENASLGVAMVVLEKLPSGEHPIQPNGRTTDVLSTIDRLQRVVTRRRGTYDLVRGAKVFYKNQLYIIKPLARRFWSKTAALNDADEIAATILMRPAREGA